MNKTIQIDSLDKIHEAAREFILQMGNATVFAFNGEMGAGKTTFIKAICEELGVEENITSPTFAIVNEYTSNKGLTIFHFDCYRLKNIREAYDIGAEEYFYSGKLCFIEWPEKIEEILPEHCVNIYITVQPNGSRNVDING
ncbi:MAG TPA: tRNA (adenosine(37)-N6)-threonylcarbamoyltransferase complex ATPase subunit type 1 TsaE [Prolixibacteraceae bacterium]|mgnify:FL=1|nr:tRNA (adenosine(37)-N6)-threonylcarbamoyltransferase complex ATPase subunit type 1 TsaE [Bacteroidales bacterium]HPB05224.1 tRNA (adenosine(37)-N6)-threonylcarbamoyltransferase complex ATPase subunit type 1 TsaE [Prolixibacteraceae bacterium]HQN93359.1 tRNA (adenosine(37)-N6)-threonylcarbamoyltransferase complex ATPase subunit type 1 TsaE [Prolixibacteraceae bacterium]HUM88380.1 tRNA (adenosine(37)-N6)-threonylcarbamoyltransferase complex ATPase subunit type 1 TsaE [Prolixibacteraceae bacteri